MSPRARAARLMLTVAPRLRRFLEVGFDREAAPMSLPRYRVMRRLAAADCRNIELAADAGVRPPTMSGLVEPMVRAAWVTRTSDPTDRRAAVLHLTAAGRRVLRAAEERIAAHVESLFTDLGAAQLDGLVAVLEHITEQLAETGVVQRHEKPGARRRAAR